MHAQSLNLAKLIAFALLIIAGPSSVFADGTWTLTGSMSAGRIEATATLLPNGEVLEVGGYAGVATELYDPVTGAWTASGSTTSAHLGHTATLLPDGKVLIAGGATSSNFFARMVPISIAELYDPATGTWTLTGSMTSARINHMATLLPSGKVLVAGGSIDGLGIGTTSAELYDPATGLWTSTGSMTSPRHEFTATLLPNGKVLVTGGLSNVTGGLINATSSAELYDPASGTWSATGSMIHSRFQHTATLLPSGKVLVEGGRPSSAGGDDQSAEIYDPATGTWTSTGSMAVGRSLFTATLMLDGRVLVAGQENFSGAAEIYDPATGMWATTNPMTTPRFFATATLLQNGRVLAVGGGTVLGSAIIPQASAELFDGPTNQAPVLDPIGNQSINENQTLSFTLSATDPDSSDVLTYSATNTPPGATFDPATRTFSWTPDYTQAGNYPDVEFTVMDNGTPMMLDFEDIIITVGDVNRAPIFAAVGPQQVLEHATTTFTVSASDPDGNAVTLSSSGMPSGATFNPSTGVFSWTPGGSTAGVYTPTFIATDNGSPVATSSIDVVITVGSNPTPTEQSQTLTNTVVALSLPNNIENQYLQNLNKVGPYIDQGKTSKAIDELNKFIAKVNSDYSHGNITLAVKNELVAMAQDLINALS